MRICLDARVTTSGGTSTFIQNFLVQLAETQHAHEVLLLTSRDTPITCPAGPMLRVPCSGKLREFRWTQWELARQLRRERVDVYHSLKHIGPLLCPARSMYRLTSVGQFCGKYPLSIADQAYWRLVGGMAYRRADLIIAVSEYVRRGAIEYLGLPEHRVVTVPNGLDPRFRRLEPHELASAVLDALAVDRPFLLAVGNLVPVKNFATALRTFQRLVRQGRDLLLVLAGQCRGTHAEQLRGLANELDIAERVRWAGYQSADRLVHLYNAASLLLHPSLHEGMSFTIVEAMACGLPIVANSSTSVPETAGAAGLYTEDPRDDAHMAELAGRILDDADLTEAMAGHAVARSRSFTWQACVTKTLAAYERLN